MLLRLTLVLFLFCRVTMAQDEYTEDPRVWNAKGFTFGDLVVSSWGMHRIGLSPEQRKEIEEIHRVGGEAYTR